MALPTFSAGQKLRASQLQAIVDAMNHPSVRTTDFTSRTTTSTSYTQTLTPAGLCGVSFTAPQSGKVGIHWSVAQSNNSSPNIAQSSIAIREGSTVGSGTVFLAAGTAYTTTITNARPGNYSIISGLTAGTVYNVVLEHRAFSAGTATIADREVSVVPLLG